MLQQALHSGCIAKEKTDYKELFGFFILTKINTLTSHYSDFTKELKDM